MKKKVQLLLVLVALSATTVLNARTFYVNDFASYISAIAEINSGSGGDTIQITSDIAIMNHPPIIKGDVTVTAETNADGTPKYTLTPGIGYTMWFFDIQPKTHFSIENVMIDKAGIGVHINLLGSDANPVIRINNCIITNSSTQAVWINGFGAVHPQITISNSTFNINGACGINIESSETLNEQDLTIYNCKANNNQQKGISIRSGSSVVRATIHDCVTDGNTEGGIYFDAGVSAAINNCSASHNRGHAFEIGKKSKISDCVALDNGTGFWGECSQVVNCISKGNKDYGFYFDHASIINNCSAIGTLSGSGFNLDDGLITNSTSINNEGYGFDGDFSSIINCTFAMNKTGGVSGESKLYNSISYGNANADLEIGSDVVIYNSVYGIDYYADSRVQTQNCRTDDPKLQGKTETGLLTENLYDIAYYSLGEGSSAAGLADKSVINREQLIAEIPDYVTDYVPDAVIRFDSIVTETYLADVMSHDQIGTVRSFDGNHYDAGSIAGIGGTTAKAGIITYSPNKVANYGENSILFYGYGFDNNTKISLKKQGESDITAENIITGESAYSGILKCNAAFNFNKKSIGKWDIVVNFSDTTITIPEGLEIEPYIEPKVDLDLLGSADMRLGTWTEFTVKYQNMGNVDIYNVPIIIEIVTDKKAIVSVREDWNYIVPDGLDTTQVARIDTLIDPFTGKLRTYIAPNVRYIRANETGYLSFALKIDGLSINDPLEVSAKALKPMIILNPEVYQASASALRGAGGPCGLGANSDFSDCMQAAVDIGIEAGLGIAGAFIPGFSCLSSAFSAGCNMAQNWGQMSTLDYVGNTAWDLTKTALDCATDFIPVTKIGKAVWKTVEVMKTADDWINRANMGLDAFNKCGGPGKKRGGKIVGSKDPNDKTGPLSESGSTWFSDRKDFPYVINFENQSSATAPAQEIWITDTLDLNVFDINTFEAGFIKIGSRLIEAPVHIQNFTWTIDMPEKGLVTTIDLQLDKVKGIATWHFTCIDPATGAAPTDALAGFLPPNDDNGSGQGSVVYSIQLKDGLADNAVVANKASIVFDNNEPILTPTWVNQKDIVAPTSKVTEATDAGSGKVNLKWQGADNAGGSGVYSYDVYAKQGAGDYQLIFSGTTETTAQYQTDGVSEYAFYTIATDNAGNREFKANVPDLTFTDIKVVTPAAENMFLLSPNPARTECTVTLDVERQGNMKITLLNLLGAKVMKLYDGGVEAGRFTQTFSTGSLPTGVYTVIVYTADNKIRAEKLLIVR